jgi:hypothetical protein
MPSPNRPLLCEPCLPWTLLRVGRFDHCHGAGRNLEAHFETRHLLDEQVRSDMVGIPVEPDGVTTNEIVNSVATVLTPVSTVAAPGVKANSGKMPAADKKQGWEELRLTPPRGSTRPADVPHRPGARGRSRFHSAAP